jgi:predicted GNAT family acetyltransferase
MTDASATAEITDNRAEDRYEARIGGELAGIAVYRLSPDRIVFTHTEVAPEFEGHGVAGQLAKFALDDARARGLQVVARCPYIAEYIRRHPDYKELLASHR